LEDLEALGIGFGGFGEDDLVDVERGLVEDYFCTLRWGEVDCFGDEEVHEWENEGVDEGADTECEFEAEVLDYEAGYQLSILWLAKI
jgi:hypothetical protein